MLRLCESVASDCGAAGVAAEAATGACGGGSNRRVEYRYTMNRWHNVYLDGHSHFCTSTVADWQPLLKGGAVNVLYQEWEKARTALQMKVLAYVVMPEHLHIILWAVYGEHIARFLRRTLSGSAMRITKGGLWKERPRVLPVYSLEVLQTKIDYIHRNPLRRELVENPEDWEHSSYRQLILGSQDVPFLCDSWDPSVIR